MKILHHLQMNQINMNKKELLNLLNNMDESPEVESERILLIDGLNLFFRKYALASPDIPDPTIINCFIFFWYVRMQLGQLV